MFQNVCFLKHRLGWLHIFKIIVKGFLILLAGTFVGTALLWLSYLLPVTEESVHVAESTLMLEQEGWYPTVPMMHQYRYTDGTSGINPGGILDNFTDSIMITTAGRSPDDGALHQAMNMAGNPMADGYNYYWHGYVALLRPLLLFFNYADIRVINQLLQILATTALACMLCRQRGVLWAALALTVYGLLLPISLSQSLQYSWVFYIGVSGSLIIVRFRDQLAHKQRIYFLFLIIGMITSYMDLLTYPLFTWGIPMIWWIVTGNDNETDKRTFAMVILCGIAWICGYGGLWVGKWLIGSAILHRPIWTQAWSEVQYRAGVVPHTDGYETSHWKVILDNLSVFQSVQGVLLLGGWIIWWIWGLIKKPQIRSTAKVPALLLIALSPVVWYVILHNHTYVHSHFTYRIWVVGLTALLAVMIGSLEEISLQHCSKRRRVLPAIMVLAAVAVALNVKEENFVHNGGFIPTQLKLEENTVIMQEFTPSNSLISAINLLLYAETETSQGEIEIKILEGQQVLWEYTVSAHEVTKENTFYEVPARLRLKKDITYQIRISGRNLGGGQISVGTTDIGFCPMEELSLLQIDNQKYDAQLICGFRYLCRARLRILTLAVELQLLLYWSMYLLWEKISAGILTERSGKII